MGSEGRQLGLEHVRRAIRQTRDARLARRLMAVLQVLDGESPQQVAKLMGVSPRSVYGWVKRLSQEGHAEALADKPRSGRPPLLSARQLKHLRWLLSHSPQGFGFFCTEWTVTVLRAQLQREGKPQVSEDTLRAALHKLGYVWKRPRYTLAPDPEREKKARASLAHPLLDASGPGALRG
jgi:transposase